MDVEGFTQKKEKCFKGSVYLWFKAVKFKNCRFYVLLATYCILDDSGVMISP